MATTMTVKGQVTVPKELRDAFGWKAGDHVEFSRSGDGVKLVRRKRRGRGADVVEQLRDAPWDPQLSTSRLMKLTRG